MRYMKFILILLLCLLPSLAFAGTAHYVDCSAGKNGNGSYESPWNNIPSVNSHSFSTGDDVYFKVNTTCTPSTYLAVDWSGTSGDRVVIGAYYGNGLFGLNGKFRPIIDGNNNTVPSPSSYRGLIDIQKPSVSHVTVENLKPQYSGRYGIAAKSSDNINIDNCHAYRNRGSGITYFAGSGDGVDTGIISNNIIENSGYPDYKGVGAAMEISSGNTEGATTNITVQYNKVFSSKHEGIGLYKKVTNSIVEYNTVYDIRTFHIYISQASNNIARYNLVYTLDDAEKLFPSSVGGYGVAIAAEAYFAYNGTGNNEVYGNLIAGQHIGISLGCQISNCTGVGVPIGDCKGDFSSSNCFDDTKIYNNTLIDNKYNLRFWKTSSSDSIEVKNNISSTITAGTVHAYKYSPAGVTWSHNLFDDAVTGNAATNAVIGDPALKKSSGWRSLTSGSLDGTEFSLLSDSSAINAGISTDSYNGRISASDYTADLIMMMISTDSTPDIGAWKRIIAHPKGFKIIAQN